MRMPPFQKRILPACAISVLVVFVLLTSFCTFHYTSVCKQCGLIRETTEWQFPFTQIPIFRLSFENATPVSTVLTADNIVAKHKHEWLFCQGGGHGVRCALGSGQYVEQSVESAEVAAIVAASQKYGERQFLTHFIRILFDPETTLAVRSGVSRVPTNGFPDLYRFQAWLAEQTNSFNEMVSAYQEINQSSRLKR